MGVRDYLIGSQGIQSGYAQPQGTAPEVLKLANTLARQRVQAGMGQAPSGGGGFIGKIFDLIQRPLYTTANAVDYGIQGKNPLQGAWRGFSGQDKTTYDKVLGDAGISGGWQRSLAGLGLDIGLDPTTYLGVGLEKGVTEGAAKVAMGDAIKAGLEDAGTTIARRTSEIYDAGKVATSAGGAEGDALKAVIEKAPGQTFTKGMAKQAAREEFLGGVADSGQAAYDAALAQGRGKAYLKFMGKRTPIESEAAYGVGTKIASGVKKIPVVGEAVEGVNKAFRPTATYRQGTNHLLRESTGWALNDGDTALTKLRDMFGGTVKDLNKGGVGLPEDLWGGLGKGHRADIAHAIESGTDLSHIPVEGTGKTLQDYKEALMKFHDEQFGFESGLGIKKAENQMPNYVPHIYQGGTAKEQAAFSKLRVDEFKAWQKSAADAAKKGLDAPEFIPKYNLHAAEDAGLKPVTDILDSSGQRTIDSYRKQGLARFYQAVHNEFGVHFGEEVPQGLRKKDIKGLADTMGLKKVKSPYFQTADNTALFHPEIADALTKNMRTFSDPAAGSELLKMFDKVQSMWKLNMTAVNPGHHIRNFAGDMVLNFEDGVKNPQRYMDAINILKNHALNPELATFKVGDMELGADEIMRQFSRHGGKSGFFRNEGVQLGEKGLSGLHPIERIREMAEKREDWTRLAHFLDVLDKEGGHVKNYTDLAEVARTAGQRVRKFNIDYADLTPFERKFMKRTVPFYTWMRKNIPLQLETLALDPGKINVVPKGLRALQQITGAPLSDEQVYGLNTVPQWLRELSGVRIFGEGQGRNQVYWNPSVLPQMDLAQYTQGGVKGALGQVLGSTTPLIRIPLEQSLGRRIDTGAPITQGGLEYGVKQILPPVVPSIKDIITKGGGEPTDWSKLFGLAMQNVGPQQQLGELRRQQDTVTAILKAKKAKTRPPRSWENG